jgi:hypothetical protein
MSGHCTSLLRTPVPASRLQTLVRSQSYGRLP